MKVGESANFFPVRGRVGGRLRASLEQRLGWLCLPGSRVFQDRARPPELVLIEGLAPSRPDTPASTAGIPGGGA